MCAGRKTGICRGEVIPVLVQITIHEKSPWINQGLCVLAEAVRFELTVGYQPTTVFKTAALNRSATLPSLKVSIIAKLGRFAKYFFMLRPAFQRVSGRRNTHSWALDAAAL